MTKCVKFMMAFLGVILLHEKVNGRPQDIAEAGLMAFGQVKGAIDNGAAAGDKKEFELFGAKIANEMNVAFGDAARSKRSSWDSNFLNDINRIRRSANTKDSAEQIVNSKEKLIRKRAIDDDSIVIDNSDEYDYSSSSSSSESEET